MNGAEELHLVAMPSIVATTPCFWCFSVQPALYGPCLRMLNLRCLAIVFDLDETLIVANTMKSFEDRIEALSRRIDSEDDPIRISGMSAELKRYIEDKNMLKQYIENDTILDNGKSVVAQTEQVPPLLGIQERVFRPVIRLQDRNIVLTRINPEVNFQCAYAFYYSFSTHTTITSFLDPTSHLDSVHVDVCWIIYKK